MTPLVSIIIPTHNRDTQLAKAVNSALSQSVEELEVIVIDDACTDQTQDVLGLLEKYDERLQVLTLHAPLGISGGLQRNEGVKVAQGKYISYLDDDDEYTYRSIEARLKVLEADSELDYCWGSTLFLRNGATRDWAQVCGERLVIEPDFSQHWSVGTIIPNELMHRAGVVGEEGVWWTPGRGEDQRLVKAMQLKGFKGKPVDYPTSIYGRHMPLPGGDRSSTRASRARLAAEKARREEGKDIERRPLVAPTRLPEEFSAKVRERSRESGYRRKKKLREGASPVDVPPMWNTGDAPPEGQDNEP